MYACLASCLNRCNPFSTATTAKAKELTTRIIKNDHLHDLVIGAVRGTFAAIPPESLEYLPLEVSTSLILMTATVTLQQKPNQTKFLQACSEGLLTGSFLEFGGGPLFALSALAITAYHKEHLCNWTWLGRNAAAIGGYSLGGPLGSIVAASCFNYVFPDDEKTPSIKITLQNMWRELTEEQAPLPERERIIERVTHVYHTYTVNHGHVTPFIVERDGAKHVYLSLGEGAEGYLGTVDEPNGRILVIPRKTATHPGMSKRSTSQSAKQQME